MALEGPGRLGLIPISLNMLLQRWAKHW